MKLSAKQLMMTAAKQLMITAAVTGLLTSPSYAQTVPAADAQPSVISPLPAKLCAAAEADAVRSFRKETAMTQKEITMTQLDTLPSTATPAVHPFHISVPEEALVELRQRLAAT